MLDPRVTPARGDVAAAHLEGTVRAERFIKGVTRRCSTGIAALCARPDNEAERQTELIFGEDFTVYDEALGWAWGQAARDGYVGYVRSDALASADVQPTHRVSARITFAFPRPNVKAPPCLTLPYLTALSVTGEEGAFQKTAEGYFVPRIHLSPLNESLAADPVAAALRFLGVPYLWGGRTAMGLDCSGLVQTALAAVGIAAPRDTDMQEAALGEARPVDAQDLQRGDLVFWKGHVGWIADECWLLHANAHHMEVALEPLGDAVARLNAQGLPLRAVRRL
ncbi:MAG: peptidase P60 [Alphaproteobacteria bacterium]|nr:peptidase P60 [Alphaproteobacteria bacterium]